MTKELKAARLNNSTIGSSIDDKIGELETAISEIFGITLDTELTTAIMNVATDGTLDASVLFAASYSSTGASREIIRLAFRGQVQLVISEDVVEEAERNLAAKRPDALAVLHHILDSVPFQTVAPTTEEVHQAASFTVNKDAPIVAAAKKAGADKLVTLDPRHLVDVPEVAERSGLNIVLPEDVLGEIRGMENCQG